jgi:hypothetical protein
MQMAKKLGLRVGNNPNRFFSYRVRASARLQQACILVLSLLKTAGYGCGAG